MSVTYNLSDFISSYVEAEVSRLLIAKAKICARHADELRSINAELDSFRTKCSTCRCRILPGRKCACCDGPSLTEEEAKL